MATYENALIEVFPAANTADNAHMSDAIGNKNDTAVTTPGTTKSVLGYLKGILTNLNLVKAKTDTIDNAVPSADTTNNIIERDVIGNKADALYADYDATNKSLMARAKGIQQVIAANYFLLDTVLQSYTKKIDDEVILGLTGVADSLAYKVNEIERHLHSYERWFGTAYAPSGTTHVADRIGSTNDAPFVIDAGNDNWGTWVNILGSTDTPADAGNAYYDLHKVVTTANERSGVYFIRIGYGANGAAALAAGHYTERVLRFDGINSRQEFELQMRRTPVGELMWAQCMCVSENTATMSFFIGIHEYEG